MSATRWTGKKKSTYTANMAAAAHEALSDARSTIPVELAREPYKGKGGHLDHSLDYHVIYVYDHDGNVLRVNKRNYGTHCHTVPEPFSFFRRSYKHLRKLGDDLYNGAAIPARACA